MQRGRRAASRSWPARLWCVVLALFAWGGVAGAQPVGRQFVPVDKPLIWHATTPAGTVVSSPVTFDGAEVALGDQFPDFGIR